MANAIQNRKRKVVPIAGVKFPQAKQQECFYSSNSLGSVGIIERLCLWILFSKTWSGNLWNTIPLQTRHGATRVLCCSVSCISPGTWYNLVQIIVWKKPTEAYVKLSTNYTPQKSRIWMIWHLLFRSVFDSCANFGKDVDGSHLSSKTEQEQKMFSCWRCQVKAHI